jgi:hypothetical protein
MKDFKDRLNEAKEALKKLEGITGRIHDLSHILKG